jgi:hypothetical protein
MTNAQKLEKIIEALNAGKTITFANHLTQIEISPKAYRGFLAAGVDLLRATDDHLLLNRGKRFDSVNGCKVMVR